MILCRVTRIPTARNIFKSFDIEVLEVANLADIGSRILEAKGGMVTSYGIISGQGQELYSPLFRKQEQTEDEEMEVSLT